MNRISLSIKDKYYKFLVQRHNKHARSEKLLAFHSWLSSAAPHSNYLNYFSDYQRSVELRGWECAKESLIVTCYFINKVDPQHGMVRRKADFEYIRPWYESVMQHNLEGIILHDGVDNEFIELYENENIKFRKVVYGNYSIFEERWFSYYQFLDQTNLKQVFFTDVNDVIIGRNPFVYTNGEAKLFVGRDEANKIRHSEWLESERAQFISESHYQLPKTYLFQSVYNAGVVGGESAIVKALIAEVINLTLLTASSYHKDMTLLNLAIHNYFPVTLFYHASEKRKVNPADDPYNSNEYLISGYPFNSAFQKNERESGAVFIHK